MIRRPLSVRLFILAVVTVIIAGCEQAGVPGNYSSVDGEDAGPLLASTVGLDELWVIVEPERRTKPEDVPGTGTLIARIPGTKDEIPIPLKHTNVSGHVEGFIATVDVQQQFHNPYNLKIEAQYVFPLPQNAAVNDFVMTIGDRKIRGIIRKREEAEAIYESARSQGFVASLLTQERPNVFTQSVANIEPGKQIDIDIQYFHTLEFDDGWYEYVFPMVVGPRFNPPATSDGIGAVARGQHGASGQPTEVQYLSSRETSSHDVSLSLTIDAGVEIEEIKSVNHRIATNQIAENRMEVKLATGGVIPNQDFVLRYRVAGDTVRSALMTHHGDQDGSNFFTLVAYPPEETVETPRSPLEMIFVLDCSGSMRGQPLEQSKQAVACALQNLRPEDSFQIIRFSSDASSLGAAPILATPANIKRGLRYLNGLNGNGGTQMIEGIRTALDFSHDESRYRFVTFMTDGYIGNEANVLRTVHDHLGDSRIFSFGVGQAPNRYLMDRMAVLGRGAVAYLSLKDSANDVMQRFADRISHPALTDVTIDWGQASVSDVYPRQLSDLVAGRQLVITGRYEGELDSIKIAGTAGGRRIELPVIKSKSTATHSGIPSVWARQKIADLMTSSLRTDNPELKEMVTDVAITHRLVSSFTSMVAVDSMAPTAGEFGTTVAVPVPVPEGVQYETTVAVGNGG